MTLALELTKPIALELTGTYSFSTHGSGTLWVIAEDASFQHALQAGDGCTETLDGWVYLLPADESVTLVQVEEAPYPTSFIDGIRAAESLIIPTTALASPWTLEMLVRPLTPQVVTGKTGYLWHSRVDEGNDLALKLGEDGKPYLRIVSDETAYTTAAGPVLAGGQFYVIAARGDGVNMALFVDGVPVDEAPYREPLGAVVSIHVGTDSVGANAVNAVYSSLRVSDRAHTDAEILDSYQRLLSGQPLPIAEDTTYYLPCQGNLDYGLQGQYVSPPIDLTPVGAVATSDIAWEDEPEEGIIKEIYTRVGEGEWLKAENGKGIPGLRLADNLAGLSLTTKTVIRREPQTGGDAL